jgi:acylphosphatase
MDTAQFNPAMLAALAQFLQSQASAPATVAAPVPVVPVAKKIEVICKKNDKDGVVMDNIAVAQYPTSEEFSKTGQYGRMFAKAAMAGKPLPEGYVRINKNGAVSILVDADYTTKAKMRLIIKTDPATRLKAWRAYTEAAKKVTGITIGGLDQAIKAYTAEPGAAPLTFKAKVENLMKEPISDAEKIKRISEMLEDGRSKTAEAPAPEAVAEEAPAPKKRATKKKPTAE